jgi:signal transduction histidine kinase
VPADAADEGDELAALVAHEFRGPVHALQAYLSVLLRGRAGPLTEIQQDFLASMYSVTRRLERLTNDIQVLTSPQERFSIMLQQVNLWRLADACRWELTPLAQEFQVALQLGGEEQPLAPAAWQLWADPVRLEQVLLNLLENAIRYAAVDSTVWLRLRQSGSRLLLVVENTSDVALGQAPALWLAPFQRGERSASRHPRGSGLGLHVVRMLVDAHGGHLLTRVREQQVSVAICLPRQQHLEPAD